MYVPAENKIRNTLNITWNMPSGIASIIAASITALIVMAGYIINDQLNRNLESARINQRHIEIARALVAEISGIRENAQGICITFSKIIVNGWEPYSGSKSFLTTETTVWSAYAKDIGFLEVSEAKSVSWFYNLHDVVVNMINSDSFPLPKRLEMTKGLVLGADKAISSLSNIAKYDVLTDNERIRMPNGQEPCSSSPEYVAKNYYDD